MSSSAPSSDLAAFQRGTVDLIEAEDLAKRLAQAAREKRPLRVKFGMDPSSPDLHVGHSVPLLKLRDLQRAGHQIVLIVGDATAMVGDPSGRNKLRPTLSREQVEANLVTYTEQASLVLDMERTEVHRNSEWFDAMSFEDVLRLCSRMTVAQMLERDTFQSRMRDQAPIGVHEFLYPLMQGWDSVMIRADVEIGGTDQLWNLLVGRALQEQEGQAPQICMTTPLINGLDGRKMSKSYGNAIGLTEAPNEMFGKVMRITDEPVPTWFEFATRVPRDAVAALLAGHPRDAKARLAEEITTLYHGAAAAAAARAAFDSQFRDRELPEDIPEVAVPWPAEGLPLFKLLALAGLVASSSEARRVVAQGGAKLDGEVAQDPLASVPPADGDAGLLLQVGKRRFARVRPAAPGTGPQAPPARA